MKQPSATRTEARTETRTETRTARCSSTGKIARRIAILSVLCSATIVGPLVGSSAEAMDPPCVVNGSQLRVVRTYDRFVDSKSINNPIAEMYPTGAINVTYLSGTVWSGTWFTTPNGPAGWTNWRAPSTGRWSAPGVNMFSLVGQIYQYDVDGAINIGATPYSAAWAPQMCIHLNGYGQYDMAMNDDYRGDNTGGFWVRVQVLDR